MHQVRDHVDLLGDDLDGEVAADGAIDPVPERERSMRRIAVQPDRAVRPDAHHAVEKAGQHQRPRKVAGEEDDAEGNQGERPAPARHREPRLAAREQIHAGPPRAQDLLDRGSPIPAVFGLLQHASQKRSRHGVSLPDSGPAGGRGKVAESEPGRPRNGDAPRRHTLPAAPFGIGPRARKSPTVRPAFRSGNSRVGPSRGGHDECTSKRHEDAKLVDGGRHAGLAAGAGSGAARLGADSA